MYIICTLASSSERSDMASCTDMAGYYYVAIIRFHVQCCWLQQHCQLPVRQRTIYFVIMGELRIANSWLKQTKTIKSNLKYISLYLCIQQIAHILKLMNILSKDPDISEHHTEPFEMCGTSITRTTRTRLLSTHWIGECHIKIHSDHTTHTAAMQLIPLFVNIKSKSVFSLGKIRQYVVCIYHGNAIRSSHCSRDDGWISSLLPFVTITVVVTQSRCCWCVKAHRTPPSFPFLNHSHILKCRCASWKVDLPNHKQSVDETRGRNILRKCSNSSNGRSTHTIISGSSSSSSVNTQYHQQQPKDGGRNGRRGKQCARWKSQQIENRSGNKIKWFWKIDFS